MSGWSEWVLSKQALAMEAVYQGNTPSLGPH